MLVFHPRSIAPMSIRPHITQQSRDFAGTLTMAVLETAQYMLARLGYRDPFPFHESVPESER
jgi:hypothetical protein